MLYLLVLSSEFADPVLDHGREPATATTDFDGLGELTRLDELVDLGFAESDDRFQFS